MGTSTSYKGPTGSNPLLPPWAQPAPQPPPSEEEPPSEQESPTDDETSPPADDLQESDKDHSDTEAKPPDKSEQHTQLNAAAPLPALPQVTWAAAKRSLTRYVKEGGKENLSLAGRAYVRARGGARIAARSATASRYATAALGNFLQKVASGGVEGALETVGMANLVGQSAEAVLATLADALVAPGELRDDTIAREAMSDVLEELYEQYDLMDKPLTALDSLDADSIRQVLQSFVAKSIYHRWIADLGRCIERGAISEQSAVAFEREMQGWVRETVALELEKVDVLQINWQGPEGQGIAEKIHAEAYSFLEEAAQ